MAAPHPRAEPFSRHCRRHPARAPAPEPPYDRRTELPRVLPLWPHELEDETPQGRQRILAKLRSALRAERRRGLAGHWTYDLARHAALWRVYRRELAAASGRPITAEAGPGARPSGRP